MTWVRRGRYDAAMQLEPGTTLLQYRLSEKIGEGGMGVVWRAVDTSLQRDVAIKVLPETFAADDERLARFDREARLLASLNHPHIAGIYGIHHTDGVHFLAMEYVAGEDLQARLARGPLTGENALRIARDVATGLEAAHESGVVHRDLKPANVKLGADGKAKVLDFGLAKVADAASGASGDSMMSPTITSAGTVAGVILGTASYMSPEQAAGQPIDRRCDIWAFGVLLYELLTGKRMFEGETVSHTLADVLRAEVDLVDLPSGVPRSVRALLRRCLERDPMRRLRDIGEARIVLSDALERPEEPEDEAPLHATTVAARGVRPAWLVAVLVPAIAIAGAGGWFLRGAPPPEPTRRFSLSMPNSGNLRQGDGRALAISPDGTRVVTRGGAGTDDIFYVRALDRFEPAALAGTSGAISPEFSPDGRWIAFVSGRGLQKIRSTGGAPVRIGALAGYGAFANGAHWATDDFIYYTEKGRIWRLFGNGGEPEPLTPVPTESGPSYAEPFALPKAGLVLCNTQARTQRTPELFAIALETGEIHNLGMPGSDAQYLPTGHLLFRQDDRAMVGAFDLGKLEFVGAPVPALERVAMDRSSMQIAVSANGTVAYLPMRPGDTQSLVYVDHVGTMEPVFTSDLPFATFSDLRISPDGSRVAVSTGYQIWMIDLRTQTPTLLTESGFYPLWSPDGSQLIYGSTRGETFDVYGVPVDLSRPETLLLDAKNNMRTMDWAPQNIVVLREQIPEKGMDLLTWADVADSTSLTMFLDGQDDELAPDVSPDGRWIAYVSNYSGSDEIYVTSFPVAGARSKVSNQGGHSPVWSPDGRTLYYVQGLKMIAASIETTPAIRIVDRKVLFEEEFVQYRWSRQFDLTPDGTRFIMIKNPPRSTIEVITNWFAELRTLTD